jgi:hypothetical protein
MKRISFKRALVASATLLAFIIGQETWALAGTTGGIAGYVKDSSGAPISDARVQAVSPSQTATTTTDAGGHFIMLSLAPDTYTLNVSKPGFQQTSATGEVVFADQNQQVAITMTKQLLTIGHVTAQGGGNLVKSGVGGDLYNVNASQAAAAAALGGGSNLNSAYSAMATVPGVQVNVGGAGWGFNAAYVRGQNAYYTGYEYDGIPINRSFDNYNASTESSLGLQQLQVYTGGGPSSVATAGTAGFINQVIKTGTYPGFASANLGIGAVAFYHFAQVEVAGASPDRNFSYYAGFSGSNQAFRLLNNQNGANLMQPGGLFSGPTIGLQPSYNGCVTPTCQGVKPTCPLLQAPLTGFFGGTDPQGCWVYYSGLSASPSLILDRENVVNLHLGIPKHNGLRDDVQLLWSGSAINNWSYSSPNDVGTSFQQFNFAEYGAPYGAPLCNQRFNPGHGVLTVTGCQPGSSSTFYPHYGDNIAYNVAFGTPISRGPGQLTMPSIYYAPDTPAHQFDGPIPLYDQPVTPYQNDTGITKLQYTYALSQSAYLRAYGYTFYSDWLQNSPLFGSTDQGVPSLPAAQYILPTHTLGGALEFNDQINDQNLLGANLNYTTANVIRFNNTSAYSSCLSGLGCSPIGYLAIHGSKFTCYDPTSGSTVPCLSSGYYDVASKSSVAPTWTSNAVTGPTGYAPASSDAARGGATWDSLWNGNVTGALNDVRPRFFNASISDQWRPNDRFLLNASLRYDDFTYELPDSNSEATQFYASQLANYSCVLASNNQLFTTPLAAGQAPPAPTQYINGDCNAGVTALAPAAPHTGWVHPNGKTQDGVAAPNFTAASPSSYTLNYWEPRVSATYTFNPDTVVRASAGRFTQPPISASVQYLSASGDNRSVWSSTIPLGFYSPFHPLPGISSAQYDMSLEKHLHGTDMSFKLTPFYTWVNQWQQQTFIGSAFVTQVPVGVNRDYGVEFQFSKGDFSRNGLSGLFAFTYTDSKVQFQNEPLSTGGIIPNTTIALNGVIDQYNALTKAGGGSPCYRATLPVACSAPPITINKTTYSTIYNPYYNQAKQFPLDPNGWYNPYTTAIAPSLSAADTSYISPITSSLILNYRHNKIAITPSIQLQTGGFYGSPLDVTGLDPRTCIQNSAASGITKVSPKTNPLQCNYLKTDGAPGLGQYGYLYIPNPQTGVFSGLGSFQNPSLLTGNLQITYEATPKLTVTLTGANLFHACFGGSSEPWTAANPPSPVVCGYSGTGSALNSTIYPSNFYNGTGINDFAANKAHTPYQQSYYPTIGNNGGIGGALQPFNLYLNAQVKI